MKEGIGERILRLRNSKDWSRPQLGREMATAIKRAQPFSGEAIRRWEEGLDLPGREARAALAKVFNHTEAYIEYGPNYGGPARQQHPLREPSEHDNVESLTPDERAMIASYRKADPRWQLSLRLLAALADPEDQIDAATDVNVVVARVMGKRAAEVKYTSDQRVAEAFGEAPHVAERKEQRRK